MRNGVALWRTLFATVILLAVVVVSGRNQVFGEGGMWTARAPMPTARASLAVGVVDGILYAVGGSTLTSRGPLRTVEAYDPTNNTWAAKVPIPTAQDHYAIGVVNKTLYAVGGVRSNAADAWLSWAYDPSTNTWTAKAPMPTPRAGLGAGVVNGVLYAVGGQDGAGPVGTLEAYNPTTNTWTAKAPMPTPRVGVAIGVVDGILYAIGGSCCAPGHGSRTLTTVEAYNPTTNMWTVKAPVPTPRYGHAVGVVNGILYAVGGAIEDKGAISTVEAYDPTRNRWTASAPMPAGRSLLAVGVVNGILYAVGGLSSVKTPYIPPLKVTVEGSNYAFKPRP